MQMVKKKNVISDHLTCRGPGCVFPPAQPHMKQPMISACYTSVLLCPSSGIIYANASMIFSSQWMAGKAELALFLPE